MLKRLAVGLALVAVIALAVKTSSERQPAHANGCSGAASYSWSGTVIPYGVRDFTVSFCGPDSLDAQVSARWNGNKRLAVQLIEPDGTIHTYSGTGSAAGELVGPLASGNWIVVVRNLTSSNVRFTAGLAFQ